MDFDFWKEIPWIITLLLTFYSSVQFSRSVMSDSLWPDESPHARLPCPSPSPGVYSDSRPSSQWCHPAISSSVVPFSSCPQSLPASESFPMSTLHMRWPKYWSFSFSIIPSKEIPGLIFRMDWLDCSPRDSQESSPTPQFKSSNSSVLSFLHSPTLTLLLSYSTGHIDWLWHSVERSHTRCDYQQTAFIGGWIQMGEAQRPGRRLDLGSSQNVFWIKKGKSSYDLHSVSPFCTPKRL